MLLAVLKIKRHSNSFNEYYKKKEVENFLLPFYLDVINWRETYTVLPFSRFEHIRLCLHTILENR